MRYNVVTERCQAQRNTVHWITTLQTSHRGTHVATQELRVWPTHAHQTLRSACYYVPHRVSQPSARANTIAAPLSKSRSASHRALSRCVTAAVIRDCCSAGSCPGWSVRVPPRLRAPGLWFFCSRHGARGHCASALAGASGRRFLSWSQTRNRSILPPLAINIAERAPRLVARRCQRLWQESIAEQRAPYAGRRYECPQHARAADN